MKISGLEQLLSRMQELPKDIQRKGLRVATRRGAAVIRDIARQNALRVDDPQTAESIARNITVRLMSRKSKSVGGVVYSVGVQGGARQYAATVANVRKGRAGKTYRTAGSGANPGGDTWYWRMLEFGTSKMPARPILRPAAESGGQQALQEVADQLDQEISKSLMRLK